MYEDYLIHYRTPGSKNGYTKYPDKYTPVGTKAKPTVSGAKNVTTWPSDKTSEEKMADNIYNTFRTYGVHYQGPKATTEDDFKTFMKRDLSERADALIGKLERYKANDYAERISKFLDTAGLRNISIRDIPNKIKNASNDTQKYAKAVADFLLPTDRKRQANLDDNFVDFVAKDIGDRYNAATNNIKKKIKEKLTSKKALGSYKRFVKRGAKKIANMIQDWL